MQRDLVLMSLRKVIIGSLSSPKPDFDAVVSPVSKSIFPGSA